jgi:hypothetical protein
MIDVTRQTLWPVLAFGIVLATPAFAQGPSEAQREAIKSNCRSDYMAHCSSIPPGGAASLQCLQQNMGSLSASCASAVKAVGAPAETKSEPAAGAKEEPAKQETKSEPASGSESAKSESTKSEPAKSSTKAAGGTGGKPTSAQISAVRSNCRSDYPKVCAGVPTGGAPALQCLEKNKAKLSAACEKAVTAAVAGAGGSEPASASGGSSGGGAGGASANVNSGAGAGGAAPPPPLVLRPLLPREILFVLRSACGADVRSLCAGVAPGGGRIIECLATQSASLSPACRDVLGEFAAR